jgi:hypothetical protein
MRCRKRRNRRAKRKSSSELPQHVAARDAIFFGNAVQLAPDGLGQADGDHLSHDVLDSNTCRISNLQSSNCQRSHKCRGCRGALLDFARWRRRTTTVLLLLAARFPSRWKRRFGSGGAVQHPDLGRAGARPFVRCGTRSVAGRATVGTCSCGLSQAEPAASEREVHQAATTRTEGTVAG